MAVHTNQRPGCLASFLSFFKSKDEIVETILEDDEEELLPYRLRDDFLSPAEFSFYKILVSATDSRFTILSKVRLADIFFVAHPDKNISYLNRIAQRHVDFLLCAPNMMKPLAGIELDDSSHNQSSRQQRDEFVDQVFLAAGLPLLHIPVQSGYSAQDIAGIVAKLLDGNQESTLHIDPVEKTAGSIPLCPKCGIPMVLRTASQGVHKGQQFYGCQNYPRCREVSPFKTNLVSN